MSFDPIIIDDAVPKTLSNEIESLLFSNDFPWFYLEDITYSSESITSLGIAEKTPAFVHTFLSPETGQSHFNALVKLIPLLAMDKAGITNEATLVYARAFFQLAGTSDRKHNNPHVDMHTKHLVCLYYVNDSSGDTYFFGKTRDSAKTQTVTPKKGRAVLFDGATYHASSAPQEGRRAVINFNLLLSE